MQSEFPGIEPFEAVEDGVGVVAELILDAVSERGEEVEGVAEPGENEAQRAVEDDGLEGGREKAHDEPQRVVDHNA